MTIAASATMGPPLEPDRTGITATIGPPPTSGTMGTPLQPDRTGITATIG